MNDFVLVEISSKKELKRFKRFLGKNNFIFNNYEFDKEHYNVFKVSLDGKRMWRATFLAFIGDIYSRAGIETFKNYNLFRRYFKHDINF